MELRTNARVEMIEVKDGRATGAVYIDRLTGARQRISAEMVVVAANGIGTPRLLLMSAQKGHADGLANSHGLVAHRLNAPLLVVRRHVVSGSDLGIQGGDGLLHALPGVSAGLDPSRGFVNGMTLLTLGSFGATLSAMGTHTAPPDPWGDGPPRRVRPAFRPPRGVLSCKVTTCPCAPIASRSIRP